MKTIDTTHYNAKTFWNFFFTLVFLYCAFQLLFVNREFGVADNGDFTRYMKYLEKPYSFTTNWPTETTEFQKRFFNQPQIYWELSPKEKLNRWPTSAHLFWDFGKELNRIFFNSKIFSVHYWGIIFYLIQFLILYFLYKSFQCHYEPLTAFFLATPVFLILIDTQITAYYHSLYAESIIFSALTVFFGWSIWEIHVHSKETQNRTFWPHLLLGFAVFLFLIMAAFAKRQYLYLFFPAAVFWGGYLFFLQTGITIKIKSILFSLGIIVFLITAFFRISFNGPDMNKIAKAYTVSHGLYYGILMHAKDPENLLAELHLPTKTKICIGYPSGCGEPDKIKILFDKVIYGDSKLDLSMFIKAILIDPVAWIKLYFFNAKELGNFQCPLGMIPCGNREYSPTVTRPLTTLPGKINGCVFLAGAVLIAILLLLFRFHLPSKALFANRSLVLILLFITLMDIALSTFDGHQENRKHILLASYCTLLIYVQFLVLLFSVAFSALGKGKQQTENDGGPARELKA